MFLKKLEKHLAPLRKGIDVFDLWSAYEIKAGMDWKQEIEKHLSYANIILLLVSPDFIASDLCYSTGMQWAIEKNQRGEIAVIPIILRSVLWQITPIGRLQALPKNNRPITAWRDRDAAFLSVVSDIWDVMKNLIEKEYKRLGATSRDLNEAKSGIIRKSFEYNEVYWIKKPHIANMREYQTIANFIRSLELKRRKLLNKAKWIFIRRKIYNKLRYLFKNSSREKCEFILENKEFFMRYREILGKAIEPLSTKCLSC